MAKQIFGFDRPEDSPGFLLWQTTVTWQRRIKKTLDSYAISHAQFVILAVTLWLENKNQETMQIAIIRLSKLDKMTVSKSLKKLVAEGYVKRTEHKHDTRAKLVELTEKGRKLILKLVPMIEEIDGKFFATLNKTEQKSLIMSLNNIILSTDT